MSADDKLGVRIENVMVRPRSVMSPGMGISRRTHGSQRTRWSVGTPAQNAGGGYFSPPTIINIIPARASARTVGMCLMSSSLALVLVTELPPTDHG